MPVTVPREVRLLSKAFERFATPGGPVERAFLDRIRKQLKPEIQKMYERSTDPFGSSWTRKTNGAPAYRSNKMGNAIGIKREPGSLLVRYWVSWIDTADEGHTWPERSVAAGGLGGHWKTVTKGFGSYNRKTKSWSRGTVEKSVFVNPGVLNFSAFGNRISRNPREQRASERGKITKVETRRGTLLVREYKGKTTILGREVLAKAHNVGPRVLPARHQQPRGQMPNNWALAVNGAAELAMSDFINKAFARG